ncbi:MAG: hypothetical protein OXC07_05425 [Kistimonas sp.]|nr:hypothetical protein [Kistimonas sp.]
MAQAVNKQWQVHLAQGRAWRLESVAQSLALTLTACRNFWLG